MKILIGLGAALFSGAALAQTLSVTWVAPTANVDGTAITAPISYNIYTGAKGAEVKVQSGVTTAATSVAAVPGIQLCVRVTSVVNALESAPSTEVCATKAFAVPDAPTGLAVS